MAHEAILIVEDEKLIRWTVRKRLSEEDFEITEAEDGATAMRHLAEQEFDLVLLDHKLPDTTGLDILQVLNRDYPETSVVMMTAYGTVEGAVQAIKLGAFDYLTKPVNLDELAVIVTKALETTNLRREVRRLRSEHRDQQGSSKIIGESPAMRHLLEMIEKISASPATTVLLEGDSGTGKNVIAQALHYGSPRAHRPFVTITCSALTETLLESELFGHERGAFTDAKMQKKGLLEVADGGTAFLDEIGEMGLGMQSKMLRFLEDKTFKRVGGTRDITVDVRIVAATNRNLEQLVHDGLFREDLFYRLQVIPLRMPALRERAEDVPLLVSHFLDHFNEALRKNTHDAAPEAMQCLKRYHWPGNIRELRNVIERILILEDKPRIELEDLPESIRHAEIPRDRSGPSDVAAAGVGKLTLDEIEQRAIAEALDKAGHNQVRAAKILGVSRDTLRYRMKKYGLAPHGHAAD